MSPSGRFEIRIAVRIVSLHGFRYEIEPPQVLERKAEVFVSHEEHPFGLSSPIIERDAAKCIRARFDIHHERRLLRHLWQSALQGYLAQHLHLDDAFGLCKERPSHASFRCLGYCSIVNRMERRVKGRHVFVGLSGGVDSAVSAALLVRAGARVTGVFIKGWYPPGLPCTWAEDRRDAMRVAAHLHIPFKTLDASREYKASVIDYLLAEYAAGRTPNPDVMCNRDVKFGAFYRHALAEGADFIATGHYVSGEKDQRYFLWAVPAAVREKTVFPLLGMEKPQVRALARSLGLPVAEKHDSQGVCFLGAVSVDEFLRDAFAPSRGEAVDEDGGRVGMHDGAVLHTIGERVELLDAPPGPWYVASKDVRANRLTVTRTRAVRTSVAPIAFTDANWLHAKEHVAYAQYRYRGPFVAGTVHGDAFVPREPLGEQVAAGQSLVFYDARHVLVGGGTIA